jgi:DNA-binding NarL/FixJ family response regulator
MNRSKIFYFYPIFNHEKELDELESIKKVIDIISENSDIAIDIIPSWPALLKVLQEENENNILVVFRLDFLERKNMSVDEVLSMLTSLTKFVTDKIVNVAVVVLTPCDQELLIKLKRNNVLGIIPGLRYFGNDHSIEAYTNLREGKSHWPEIALAPELKRVEIKKKEISLSGREYEIFNLVARRGLSNKKISQMLSITEDTVKYHVGNIFKKYGVKNRTQLALCNRTGVIN